MGALEEIVKNKVPFVTVSTVAVYFIALAFQYGYAFFYGYPSEFIEIGVDTLLKTVSWVFIIIFPAVSVLYFYYITYKLERFWAVFLAIGGVFFLLYISVVGAVWPQTFLANGGFYIVTWMIFLSLYPVIFLSEGLMRGMLPFNKISIGETLFLLPFIIVFAFSIGSLNAYKMINLFEVKNKQGVYLITSYGEKLVLGSCNKDEKIFSRTEGEDGIQFIKVIDPDEIDKVRACFLKIKKSAR
ncbi:hypothetical protein [Sodalis sp. RH16]|uniref:hypothetical protein n=1 Tax=Sodalis sp. RH16 TaxID=3394331 RepID=UPI0039B64B5C